MKTSINWNINQNNERHGNVPLGVYRYVVPQLLDCCAHDGVGFAIAEDEELTIADNLLVMGHW